MPTSPNTTMEVVHTTNDGAFSFISVRADRKKDAITQALDRATDAAGEWASAEVVHTEPFDGENIYVVRVSYDTDTKYEQVRFA